MDECCRVFLKIYFTPRIDSSLEMMHFSFQLNVFVSVKDLICDLCTYKKLFQTY